jgi:hypothetical protein
MDRVIPLRSSPISPWEISVTRLLGSLSPPPSSDPDLAPSAAKQGTLYGLRFFC